VETGKVVKDVGENHQREKEQQEKGFIAEGKEWR